MWCHKQFKINPTDLSAHSIILLESLAWRIGLSLGTENKSKPVFVIQAYNTGKKINSLQHTLLYLSCLNAHGNKKTTSTKHIHTFIHRYIRM